MRRCSRQEERARRRAKYYLLDEWERKLDALTFEGDANAGIVRGYRPQGLVAPYEVPEIAGLIVAESDGTETHLRLYRDRKARLISASNDPGAPIVIDPLPLALALAGPDPISLSGERGVPDVVDEVVDALGIHPAWRDACPDGEHDICGGDDKHTPRACSECSLTVGTLSWLGHQVRYRAGGEPVADGGTYRLPHPGDVVVDREAADDAELVVVETHPERSAADSHIQAIASTVADVNPKYDAAAPVAEAVYLEEAEETLDGFRSVEALRDAVGFDAIGSYAFPCERLASGGGRP